ncbi:MAG: hypothetical protein NWE89_13835 [Candidatus Bathyarchaeota archaeon]|nr:hypothetical protein [Candidatus Bathyarchaeota archaeon]
METYRMNMPTVLANIIQRTYHTKEYRKLAEQNVLLTKQLSIVQASVDVTTNTTSTSTVHHTGTPSKFSTYTLQVAQLAKLYENTADWGCMIGKNVIDVRTAFSVGQGVKVKKHTEFKGNADRELEWCKEFMRFNNLDEEMPQEFAKEAEIEGKVLLRLLVDTEAKNIRIIHVPWRKFNYTITTPDYDFFNYIRAEYIGSGEPGIKFNLPPALFIYKRFGGIVDKVNETPPKTAFVLREMEDLDKAIWDWRKINTLFSAPTPTLTAPDKATAKELKDWVDGSNWKIGKLLVLGGENVKYELVGWKGDGFTTLQAECETLVKTISGTTGVPVQFLGYPELLSNRDTAENLMELIALSTDKERRTWIGAYEELFQKAMVIYNVAYGTSLDPTAIDAEINKTIMSTTERQGNATVPNRNSAGNQQE